MQSNSRSHGTQTFQGFKHTRAPQPQPRNNHSTPQARKQSGSCYIAPTLGSDYSNQHPTTNSHSLRTIPRNHDNKIGSTEANTVPSEEKKTMPTDTPQRRTVGETQIPIKPLPRTGQSETQRPSEIQAEAPKNQGKNPHATIQDNARGLPLNPTVPLPENNKKRERARSAPREERPRPPKEGKKAGGPR